MGSDGGISLEEGVRERYGWADYSSLLHIMNLFGILFILLGLWFLAMSARYKDNLKRGKISIAKLKFEYERAQKGNDMET